MIYQSSCHSKDCIAVARIATQCHSFSEAMLIQACLSRFEILVDSLDCCNDLIIHCILSIFVNIIFVAIIK